MDYPPVDQMIGQLLLTGFKGDKISSLHPVYSDIKERNLGGVILFDRHLSSKSATNNIVSGKQLRRLTADLQDIREEKLLIAVDQEGGKVNRFRGEFGFPQFPGAEELGNSTNPEQTRSTARELSKMLKSYGVNWNLAPVVDINSNPENPIIGAVGRSFSSNPLKVTEQGEAWIDGHKENKILTCLKHFPGHGSSEKDSHLGFVDISSSWQRDELLPYQRLIDKKMAQSIMLGHLFHEGFDSKLPASLSANTVSYLRREMSFAGVIITDDMQMRAITDKYGINAACIMAIQAGVDIVIIGNNLSYTPDLFATLHRDMLRGIDQGTLTTARVKESWQRVQQLKSLLD